MAGCNGHSTPMEVKVILPEGEGLDKDAPYQELIGCLLYLSTNTRPDIAYVVSFLSHFNSKHTEFHWNLGKRVQSYLKKTSKLGLKYKRTDKPTYCLTGFADADMAGNPKDYYSYCGFCFNLNGNLISWESRKQTITAQSSTESE